MKLRIKDNTIRIRLAIDELGILKDGQEVRMTTRLGVSSLTVVLHSTNMSFDVKFQENTINISVNQSTFNDLWESEEEGFENRLMFEDSENLHVLIQKDYKCIGREESLNSGLFNHKKKNIDAC